MATWQETMANVQKASKGGGITASSTQPVKTTEEDAWAKKNREANESIVANIKKKKAQAAQKAIDDKKQAEVDAKAIKDSKRGIGSKVIGGLWGVGKKVYEYGDMAQNKISKAVSDVAGGSDLTDYLGAKIAKLGKNRDYVEDNTSLGSAMLSAGEVGTTIAGLAAGGFGGAAVKAGIKRFAPKYALKLAQNKAKKAAEKAILKKATEKATAKAAKLTAKTAAEKAATKAPGVLRRVASRIRHPFGGGNKVASVANTTANATAKAKKAKTALKLKNAASAKKASNPLTAYQKMQNASAYSQPGADIPF